MELKYPLNIQIELTENCNHSCTHCYNYWRPKKENHSNNLSIKDAKTISEKTIDQIKPFHITLTGGEPFLNKEVLHYFLYTFSKQGLFVNINSNITLISHKDLEKILGEVDINKFGFLTSLPHFEKIEYERITHCQSIESFYRNLEMIIKKEKIPITINMVVSKKTLKDVYQEAEFLSKMFGIKNFAATPMVPPPYKITSEMALDKKEIIELFNQLIQIKKDFKMNVDALETIPRCLFPKELLAEHPDLFDRSCSAGRSTISIAYNGEVRACSHMPFSNGNLLIENFDNIWEKLKPFRENKYVPEDCLKCVDLERCNGGCRIYDFFNNKNLRARDLRMTAPLKEPIKPLEKKVIPIDENKKYFFNQNSIMRQDREDISTLFNGRFQNVLFINDSFLKLIESIKKEGICLKDHKEEEGYEKLYQIANLLYQKRYIF